MALSSRVLKAVVVVWLCAVAGCFAPSRIPRQPAAKLVPVGPVGKSLGARTPASVQLDSFPGPIQEKKRELFGNWRPRLSLRRWIQRLQHVRISPQNRHRFAALVFAGCLWLRGGFPLQAHANAPNVAPTPVEHIQMISGGSDEAATEEAVPESSVGVKSNGAKSRTLAKAVIGAAVVIPSAGWIYSRVQGDDQDESAVDDDLDEDTKTSEGTSSESKNMVDKSRPKVDADTYLKSLQKEKSLISSALSKLNRQIESAAEADEKAANRIPQVSHPIAAEKLQYGAGKTSTDTATDAELPLMSRKYIEARRQPKSAPEEKRLSEKYEKYTDVGEKAFAILVDLGMIETTEDIEEKAPAPTTFIPSMEGEEEPFQ
ncbi:expressed unknown protein [Seminavis robusta]|uniref:Transmembrane protein n=1 Tax=Seminavis robusta TaxID=568900 RepID=A0A9N8DU80_9STRA|nr:expressed unknown protein [Seminavis robusta]|eukprot:Sro347_g122820.1 n/a (373) ;mRNA; r:7113-8382